MLIQRLENENQAYSIKLEVRIIICGEIESDFLIASFSLYINYVQIFEQVLQNEFNQLKKKRESSNFDSGIEKMKNKSFGQSFGQSFFTAASDASYDDSTSSMSGVSAISGASKLTPLERDNKKLRKQKILFENRVRFFEFCELSDGPITKLNYFFLCRLNRYHLCKLNCQKFNK